MRPDGTEVEYFTIAPPGRRAQKLPLHVDVHGGPHGAWPSGRWLAFHQAVAAAGRVFAMDADADVTAFDLKTGGRIWREGTRGLGLSVTALGIGLFMLAYPGYLAYRFYTLPPINDITTDANDPPRFEAVARLRPRGANWELSAIQQT